MTQTLNPQKAGYLQRNFIFQKIYSIESKNLKNIK